MTEGLQAIGVLSHAFQTPVIFPIDLLSNSNNKLRVVNMPAQTRLDNLYKYFLPILWLSLILIFNAQSLRANELHFVLNGKSVHIEKKPNQTLNERNLGVGFQYEFQNFHKYWTPFINVGGFSDSYEKPSYYIGGGVFHRYKLPSQLLGLHFDAGLTGFMMTKADINDNEPFPGVLPIISIGNNMAALNITYVPKITDEGTDLWFMQLKLKLAKF